MATIKLTIDNFELQIESNDGKLNITTSNNEGKELGTNLYELEKASSEESEEGSSTFRDEESEETSSVVTTESYKVKTFDEVVGNKK